MRRADEMAERFWNQLQEQISQVANERVIRAYGRDFVEQNFMTPIMRATREEIIEHWRACEDAEHEAAREGYPISLDPEKLWGEDVQAIAAEKVARQKRRAGYKALVDKYGEKRAKGIISREAQ